MLASKRHENDLFEEGDLCEEQAGCPHFFALHAERVNLRDAQSRRPQPGIRVFLLDEGRFVAVLLVLRRVRKVANALEKLLVCACARAIR